MHKIFETGFSLAFFIFVGHILTYTEHEQNLERMVDIPLTPIDPGRHKLPKQTVAPAINEIVASNC
jgi:hypothetical protein